MIEWVEAGGCAPPVGASRAMVTFVLPTRGRAEFTARFHRFMCRQAMTGWEMVTEDSDDRNFGEYFTKVVRLLDKVVTPYAMIVDNDDLVVWPTVVRCVRELERAAWAAYGGRVAGFRVKGNGPYGKVVRFENLFSPFDRPTDYVDHRPAERVIEGFANSWSHYAVHRTEILRQIHGEVAEMELSDLQLREKWCAMRLLQLGRVGGTKAVSYLKQYGTSQDFTHRNDFPMKLMTNQFSKDRDAILDRLGLESGDRERLVKEWAKWWDGWFRRNYGPMARARELVRKTCPRLSGSMRNAGFAFGRL